MCVPVRLVILTAQDKASGKIFEQFEIADGLGKLQSAIDKLLKTLRSDMKIDYAAHLRPMNRVLEMLASTCEKAGRRAAVRQVACAILKEYSDVVPSAHSEDVAQVVIHALCILEHLIVRCGRLTFSEVTHTYTGAPSDEDIVQLRELLSDLLDDPVFCASIKKILGQPECSLGTAGQVCSLLRCLHHADLLCFDAAAGHQQNHSSRVAEKLFTAPDLGLPNLIRLLQREIQALPVNALEKEVSAAVAALQRMCSITDVLKSLRPWLSASAEDDAALCGSLGALEQWLGGGQGNLLAPVAEAQRLLRSLVAGVDGMLLGEGDRDRWPLSIAALDTVLCAMAALGPAPHLAQHLQLAKVSQ